ncbi:MULTISPECIES: hypothetical protein [unclassified Bradyrhizobium]|uniref:hypothetical protein n=1 Tax=unclassified Bradyrhizobium TaxID=2631580 RepID=UPI001CD54290|nr:MULTISPECIES: hypothetical protein [unclassified Bradyrhizobium]
MLFDLVSIGVDACAGIALAIWLFATPASAPAIALGAMAAILPDPLQFVHSVCPQEPLITLQRFHERIHSKRKLAWKLGVSSQIAFAAVVSIFASAVR